MKTRQLIFCLLSSIFILCVGLACHMLLNTSWSLALLGLVLLSSTLSIAAISSFNKPKPVAAILLNHNHKSTH